MARLLNHKLCVKQQEGYGTNQEGYLKANRFKASVTLRSATGVIVFVFTGVNSPHKGVWRFDLSDI